MTMLCTIRFRASALLLAAAAVLLGVVSGLVPAYAASPERFAIRADQVLAVMHTLALDGAEMKLLAQLSASTATPELEVKAIDPWGERGARVRLACRIREECLPFYVSLLWPAAADAQAALRTVGARASGNHATAVAEEARTTPAPVSYSAPFASQPLPGTSVAEKAAEKVRVTVPAIAFAPAAKLLAGSHATLLLEGARLHIQVPVICLEKGAPGRTIRVSAVDHKQTYLAQVIDGTLLKGTL